MPRIAALHFEPLDIELTEPFGIAGGAQLVANNVLVRLTLDDGSEGLGEAAPFPTVSGETQAQTLTALAELASAIVTQPAERWRRVAASMRDAAPAAPAARCAVETALLDALCRRAELSLWSFFGGSEPELVTDITIPTGDTAHARAAAERAAKDGFSTLKIKIGGADHDLDLARLQAIGAAAPAARLVLDANASLSAEEAIALVEALGPLRSRVVLFEQPTAVEDLDGLRKVRQDARVLVAADESARSARDVARLAEARAADVVNIKIMKTGIVEALDMLAAARAHGLSLMVGGMVESVLCMTTSACLAAGQGGISFVDLDTPLFMRGAPFTGGFEQRGPYLRVGGMATGHGVGLP